MKRLIILLSIIAASVQAQVTNTVNISNSLLGPVTNYFTGTVVQSTGDIVLTGAVFNVTNDFSSTVTVTNTFNVGTVSVTNDIVNTVTVTNIVENIAVAVTNTTIVYSPTEFITQTHTSTPDSVRIYSGTNLATSVVAGANMDIYVEGGGGGGFSVQVFTNGTSIGTATNGINFDPSVYAFITNGQLNVGFALSQFPTNMIGTNRVTHQYGGSEVIWQVPNGISNIVVWAWGAGGGGGDAGVGSAGGFSEAYIPVTPLENLSVWVGQGGFITAAVAANFHTNTLSPWPNGGAGAATGIQRAGAGGGSSHMYRGTNLLIVAGGGGGAARATAGGNGGGISGGDGVLTSGGIAAGGGGTQIAGGSTGSTAIPLVFTNTAGDFLSGGAGGLTTNLFAKTAGGGGGGFYGGGGGLSGTAVNGAASGGGGSGYINESLGAVGATIRSSGQAAIAQDKADYISGVGSGGATAAVGGNGLIVIGY